MHIRYHLLLDLFFPLKVTKCLLKNATFWWVQSCFLRMASDCSILQKTEPAIVSLKILHQQRWHPNLQFHCRQKLLVILHYSKTFKWMRSNQNTGKMYKIIEKFLKRFCGWAKPWALVRRATFEVIWIIHVRLQPSRMTAWLGVWIPKSWSCFTCKFWQISCIMCLINQFSQVTNLVINLYRC